MSLYIASHADELGIECIIDPLIQMPLCITLIYIEDQMEHIHYSILYRENGDIAIQCGQFTYGVYLDADDTLLELIDFMGFSLDDDTMEKDREVLEQPIISFLACPHLYWLSSSYDKWSTLSVEESMVGLNQEHIYSFTEFNAQLENYLSVWKNTESSLKQDCMDWIVEEFIPGAMRNMFDITIYSNMELPQLLILLAKGHTHVLAETVQFIIEWLDSHLECIY